MKSLFILAFGCLTSMSVFAMDVEDLQKAWAVANYQVSGDAQAERFEKLAMASDEAVAAQPRDPELLIWQGIIKSTYAGKAGGLGALKLVKAARDSLEQALEIDPAALDGSAYTSLGALYYQVPGWPIAFGNEKKARALLEKALSMNPDGIDSNYFYGDFLYQQHEYAEARAALQRALSAKARPGREVADAGRREEIRALLARVDEALN